MILSRSCFTAPAIAGAVAALALAASAWSAAAAPAQPDRLAALPLTLVPAAAPGGDTLVVLYSGDGGWAALDRGVSDTLAKAGLPVVGVNSLTYFLVRKTPDGAAADLTLMLRQYMAQWNKSRFVLAGYSFGAGAAPIIAAKLPPDLRARMRMLALIDPEKAGELKFQPGAWLNVSAPGAVPLAEALAPLKGVPTICVYGAAEPAAACASLSPAQGRAIQVPGGHHYDGDFPRVGRAILGALPR